jgi:hypothetical protein
MSAIIRIPIANQLIFDLILTGYNIAGNDLEVLIDENGNVLTGAE